MSKKRKQQPGYLRAILDAGVFILIVLMLTLILKNYIFERVVVVNCSMEDTLHSDDSVIVDKFSYRVSDPKRFDVIVFKQNGTGAKLIKRIIALPGETVRISDGIIYINSVPLKDVEEIDAPDNPGLASYDMTLMEGEYFVLGDNRKESIDSRFKEVGNVTNTRIIGKAILKVYPFSEMKVIK